MVVGVKKRQIDKILFIIVFYANLDVENFINCGKKNTHTTTDCTNIPSLLERYSYTFAPIAQ